MNWNVLEQRYSSLQNRMNEYLAKTDKHWTEEWQCILDTNMSDDTFSVDIEVFNEHDAVAYAITYSWFLKTGQFQCATYSNNTNKKIQDEFLDDIRQKLEEWSH